MIISICVGSSCHLKGSREIILALQDLIKEHNLTDKVQLSGAFCMGNCVEGVCVKIDGKLYSVSPTTVNDFFQKEILGRLT